MTTQTKLSAKGQVVIPKDVRDRLGLTEGMVFDVVERGDEVVLKPRSVSASRQSAAEALREIRKIYTYEGPPVTVEEMGEAARMAAVAGYKAKNDA